MSLPEGFSNPRQYFAEAIGFLKEFSWIYRTSNTNFIKEGVLEQMPKEFRDYFLEVSNEDLNHFPFINEHELKFNSTLLADFRKRLGKILPKDQMEREEGMSSNSQLESLRKIRKISLKKCHEIDRLAGLIKVLCRNYEVFIDFGSGLGYLSEALYTNENQSHYVLGLEADPERVKAAERRQQENMQQFTSKINYKNIFVTEDSLDIIRNGVQELLPQNTEVAEDRTELQRKFAIIGLHACADLTITAIKHFFRFGSDLRALIIMPCCYHKMTLASEKPPTFHNFPLSSALKSITASDDDAFTYLNRPFLRLASQQTRARWMACSIEEHSSHAQEMFRRGLAECLIDTEKEIVLKSKQFKEFMISGVSRTKESFADFCRHYELRSKATKETLFWNEQHEARYEQLTAKYEDGSRLAEGLTCLQTAIQKLCENIVLYDRLCYIEEYASAHNLKVNVGYKKLLDEKLSPRCYVLIAEKL